MLKPFAPAFRAKMFGVINMVLILTLQNDGIFAVAVNHYRIIDGIQHLSIVWAVSQTDADRLSQRVRVVL